MGLAKSGLGIGLLAAVLSAGCQNKLYDQNKALYDENKALRDQNESLRHQAPQQPIAQQQPLVPAAPPPADTQPIVQTPPARQGAVEQIGGLETTITRSGNTVVHLPSDVFFDSGQATLKSSSKASLDKVVSALKTKFGGKSIRVEGHTDSQPIRVSKWASNQELSEARADSVKQYLVAHGISASRVTTKGLGDTRPRGTELSRNRRVEIIVITAAQ